MQKPETLGTIDAAQPVTIDDKPEILEYLTKSPPGTKIPVFCTNTQVAAHLEITESEGSKTLKAVIGNSSVLVTNHNGRFTIESAEYARIKTALTRPLEPQTNTTKTSVVDPATKDGPTLDYPGIARWLRNSMETNSQPAEHVNLRQKFLAALEENIRFMIKIFYSTENDHPLCCFFRISEGSELVSMAGMAKISSQTFRDKITFFDEGVDATILREFMNPRHSISDVARTRAELEELEIASVELQIKTNRLIVRFKPFIRRRTK